MIALLASLWLKSKMYLIIGASALLVVLGVLFGVRESGKNAERVDQMSTQLKAIRKSKEIDDAVAAYPDGAALDELRRDYHR